MTGAKQLTETENRDHRNRKVVHATCSAHGAGIGFTNLVATKRDGSIELAPHADGSCVLTLDEGAATQLRDALGAWLG
jgi:hypothetical protein